MPSILEFLGKKKIGFFFLDLLNENVAFDIKKKRNCVYFFLLTISFHEIFFVCSFADNISIFIICTSRITGFSI